MKNTFFIYLILGFTLSKCATLGSKTIYKDLKETEIQSNDTIMVFPLQRADWYNDFEKTIVKLANTSIVKTLKKEGFYVIQNDSNVVVDFNKHNISLTSVVTSSKKANYYLFPKLDFFTTRVDSTTGALLSISSDLVCEITLYNTLGKKILHSQFNTYSGKSYMKFPRPEMIVPDGAEGATKKIIRDIRNSKFE